MKSNPASIIIRHMKKSFVRKTFIMLMIQLAGLLVLLLTFAALSYNSAYKNVKNASESFLNLYCSDLEDKIDANETLLREMIYDNAQYVMLQSDKENLRYYASIDLQDQLTELVEAGNNTDFLVVAENNHKTFLFAQKERTTEAFKDELRNFVLGNVANINQDAAWSFTEINGKTYIYKLYVWQGRLAGAFISLDRFMNYDEASKEESLSLVLTDSQGVVRDTLGSDESEQSLMESYKASKDKNTITLSHNLRDDIGTVYLKTSFNGLSGQMNWGVFAVFGIILWTILFCIILTRSVNNEILSPMQSLQEDMAYIEQGNYDYRITRDFGNKEFDNLRTAFNSMLDEIVGLKISRYEKQLELSDSELRSIRFQIRPHFFLNALTTISSLSLQGKNEEIAKYIEALSKNVRYMFKSGLHTVELEEELKHVENYFEMQELKYPGSVFYFISVDDSLKKWQIPQMLIHTIIENEYKYAVSMDKNLSIFINIYTEDHEGENILCIEIEDDGKGYPAATLDAWKDNSLETEDGSRVGLWALRKMLKLMYERDGLFEIENITPHGAKNRFLIPATPKQQVIQRHTGIKTME